jgi:hypothetical protein
MPCRGTGYHGFDIRAEYKFFIICTVKEEDEFMFGMLCRNAFEGFMNKIAIAFQVIREQESRIYSDDHSVLCFFLRQAKVLVVVFTQ